MIMKKKLETTIVGNAKPRAACSSEALLQLSANCTRVKDV